MSAVVICINLLSSLVVSGIVVVLWVLRESYIFMLYYPFA